jgi:hypothetical protein
VVSRNVALIAAVIALDIAGYTGAASQSQQPYDRGAFCLALMRDLPGADSFAALKAMRAAADDASVFDYKDVASLRELLRKALAANRAADLYEPGLARVNAANCLDGRSRSELEQHSLQYRSEVAHYMNLAREKLRALESGGGH